MSYPIGGTGNPWAQRRLRNIWESAEGQEPDPSQQNVPDIAPSPALQKPATEQTPRMSEAEQYFRAMQDIRGNMPMQSQYAQALQEAPQMQDYQPSRWRRAGAIAGGIGMGILHGPEAGMETGQNIARAPYNTAMGQYNNRIGVTKAAADLEAGDVESQIKGLADAQALGLDYAKYRELGRHNRAGESVNKERARIAEIVATNPDYHYIAVPGGVKATDSKGHGEDYFIPGQTVEGMNAETSQFNAKTQRGMLGVAQTNAATNKTNAATAQATQRVGAFRANEESTNMREQRRLQEKGLSIRQNAADTAAIDAALAQMHSDPRFSDMIEYDENLGTYAISDDVDQEDYNDLMEAAENISGVSRSRRGTPIGRPRNYTTPSVGVD